MELVLVRHALPVRVEAPRGVPADPVLSDEGHAQAERAARWLATESFDRVVTSPLRRAAETAAAYTALSGAEAIVEPDVVEFDRDAQVYIPLEELKRIDYARWRELMASGWYGSMDPATFRDKVVAALDRVIAATRGGRAVVFTHGGVINVWAAHVLGIETPLFFAPHYTSIHRFLCASSGQRSLVSLNETAHLR
jgi:probable phosphoglycerate mutase